MSIWKKLLPMLVRHALLLMAAKIKAAYKKRSRVLFLEFFSYPCNLSARIGGFGISQNCLGQKLWWFFGAQVVVVLGQKARSLS